MWFQRKIVIGVRIILHFFIIWLPIKEDFISQNIFYDFMIKNFMARLISYFRTCNLNQFSGLIITFKFISGLENSVLYTDFTFQLYENRPPCQRGSILLLQQGVGAGWAGWVTHIIFVGTRGHSITTWTRFWSFLTSSPLKWTMLPHKAYEATWTFFSFVLAFSTA